MMWPALASLLLPSLAFSLGTLPGGGKATRTIVSHKSTLLRATKEPKFEAKLCPPAPQVLLSLNSGDCIPALGLGTWKLEPNLCADMVLTAIKLGYRHLDCACDYGNERQVGQGIEKAINEGYIKSRGELFITSKLWNTYHSSQDVPKALDKTLEDLGLEYLDLYLIHFPIALKSVSFEERYPPGWVDPRDASPTIEFSPVPLHETWRAMEDLVDNSRVRNIGLCNVQCAQLFDLLTYSKIMPSVVQVERHVFNQQTNLIRFCRLYKIVVIGYSSLGAPSYATIGLSKPSDSAMKHPVIWGIANKHNKSPAQVMLRWSLQTGSAVIPKSSKPSRLVENMSVFDFTLSEDDLSAIERLEKRLHFNDPAQFMPELHAFVPIFD